MSDYDPQSGDLRLSHVPALRLQSDEKERRLLPAAVQLKVHHLVVDGPQPPHRHLWVPAATLPQKPLCQQYRHRGREASMLIDSNESQKKKELKNKNVWIFCGGKADTNKLKSSDGSFSLNE